MSTLREVARAAGVSAATVSRVFSRPDAVTVETRERVLAVAAELDYAPNPVARSLALGRTGNLGLFVPDIKNPVFSSAITAVQRQARERGFALFVAAGDGRAEEELAVVQAIARQVDGLVLCAPAMSDDDLSAIAQRAPLVLINREWRDAPTVVARSGDGMAEAVRHFADAGHREILYLGGPTHLLTSRSRLAMFRVACRQRGVRARVLGPFTRDLVGVGEGLGDQVVTQGIRAVIAYNDELALGLMKGLGRHGLRAGVDVGVIGFDDSWLADLLDPPLTTVRMPFDMAGRIAVRLLLDILAGRPVDGRTHVELATRLVVRASSGATPLANEGRGRAERAQDGEEL